MKTRASFALYDKGVQFYIKGRMKNLQTLLKNPSLQTYEKLLLQTRLHLKKTEWSEAEGLLQRCLSNNEPFLLAEALMLQATLHSRKYERENAILINQKAIRLFEKVGDLRGQFLCNYNISVDYQGLRLHVLSQEHLHRSLPFAVTNEEQSLLQRAWGCSESLLGNYKKAAEHMETSLSLLDENSLDRKICETIAADIYIRAGDFQKARPLIMSFSGHEEDPDHGRRLFDKNLFLHLTEKKPLGVPPPQLAKHKELYLRWSLIYHLERGDTEQAKNSWEKLQKINPFYYGASYEAAQSTDQNALFYRSLASLYKQKKQNIHSERLNDLEKKLLEVLKQASHPLRKEELINMLWPGHKGNYDSRFYKLIERTRKKLKDATIHTSNRSYYLS